VLDLSGVNLDQSSSNSWRAIVNSTVGNQTVLIVERGGLTVSNRGEVAT